MIRGLFSKTRQLKPLSDNWQKITVDPTVLGYVDGYQIPLLVTLFQNSPRPSVKLAEEEEFQVCKQLDGLLKKKAIILV